MPMDRSKYPDNWEEISARIRHERAKDKCEQCGVPNGAEILRSRVDGSRYAMVDPLTHGCRTSDGELYKWSEAPDEFPAYEAFTKVVLTVHHVGVEKPDGTPGNPEDKMDCRDENLLALCQRCHLLADLPSHQAKRHVTINRKKHEARIEAGQGELFA